MALLAALGLSPPLRRAPAAQPAAAGRQVSRLWTDAKDLVGAQIAALQTAFRGTDDPLGHDLADGALHALTRNLQVALQVALIEYDNAAPQARAAAASRLALAVRRLRGFLDADPLLPLLEDNPFGVLVTVRSTLGQALDAIDREL